MSDPLFQSPTSFVLPPAALDGGFHVAMVFVPPPPIAERIQTLVEVGERPNASCSLRVLPNGFGLVVSPDGGANFYTLSGFGDLYADPVTDLAGDPFAPGQAIVANIQVVIEESQTWCRLYLQGQLATYLGFDGATLASSLAGQVWVGRDAHNFFPASQVVLRRLVITPHPWSAGDIESFYRSALEDGAVSRRLWKADHE